MCVLDERRSCEKFFWNTHNGCTLCIPYRVQYIVLRLHSHIVITANTPVRRYILFARDLMRTHRLWCELRMLNILWSHSNVTLCISHRSICHCGIICMASSIWGGGGVGSQTDALLVNFFQSIFEDFKYTLIHRTTAAHVARPHWQTRNTHFQIENNINAHISYMPFSFLPLARAFPAHLLSCAAPKEGFIIAIVACCRHCHRVMPSPRCSETFRNCRVGILWKSADVVLFQRKWLIYKVFEMRIDSSLSAPSCGRKSAQVGSYGSQNKVIY